jgi:hypothetical protein
MASRQLPRIGGLTPSCPRPTAYTSTVRAAIWEHSGDGEGRGRAWRGLELKGLPTIKHPLVFRAVHAGEGACGYRELSSWGRPCADGRRVGSLAAFQPAYGRGGDEGCWQRMASSEQGSYRGSAGYVYQPRGGVHSGHSRC